MTDEFYIGWEAKASPGIGKTTHKVAIILLLLALLVPVVLAVSQRMIGASVFEWGTHKTFSGILQTRPYPHLLVPRPGQTDSASSFSTYYLVAPWKFGLNPDSIQPFDGKPVTLTGSLIYRQNQTMIEVQPDTIKLGPTNLELQKVSEMYSSFENQKSVSPDTRHSTLVTLRGEIVDSKCFLGVMNPGQLTSHRACAIRCISGGVPPVLLVRKKDGPASYLLLVSADGKPVNKQVLDLVAEPVEITGEIQRLGDLLVLRADPETYRRAR